MKTASDWWTTTKAPPAMFRPRYQRVDIDQYLRMAEHVDPAILSVELGMSICRVEAYQRQLGLRKFAPTGRRHKERLRDVEP